MSKKEDQKRVDLDVRPNPNPLFRNYDYTDEPANETSPGGGLYHGFMGKYPSIEAFLKEKRKENEKKKKKGSLDIGVIKISKIIRFAKLFNKIANEDIFKYLEDQGTPVSKEVQEFILSSGKKRGFYLSVIKENPTISLEKLRSLKKQKRKNIQTKGAETIDELKNKYPKLKAKIDEFSKKDLSGNNKHLSWMIEQLAKGHSEGDILPTANYFHTNNHKFKNKDIYSYNDLKELEDLIKDIELKDNDDVKLKDVKAKKLFDNERFMLVRPDTKVESCKYGKGTKWCITMQNADYFNQYQSNNVVFYFLFDKILTKEDPNYKVAFSVERDLENNITKVEGWNALDKQHNPDVFEGYELVKDIIKQDAESLPANAIVYAQKGLLSLEEFNYFLSLQDEHFDIRIFPEKYKNLVKTYNHVDIKTFNDLKQILKNPNINDAEKESIKIRLAKSSKNIEILRFLATQSDEVREAVSINPMTPIDVVKSLFKDKNRLIKYLRSGSLNFEDKRDIIQNPLTQSIILRILFEGEENMHIRALIARHQNTPFDIIKELATDKDFFIRASVVINPNVPDELSKELLKDKDVKEMVERWENGRLERESPVSNLKPRENLYEKELSIEYLSVHGTEEQLLYFLNNNSSKDALMQISHSHNLPISVQHRLLEFNDEDINRILYDNLTINEEVKSLLGSKFEEPVHFE